MDSHISADYSVENDNLLGSNNLGLDLIAGFSKVALCTDEI